MAIHPHHTALSAPVPLDLSDDAWHTDVLPRLPTELDAKARALGAFVRVRGIACPSDLLRAILAYVLEGFSARTWGAWALLIGLADLSPTAWRNRLVSASLWLAWLLANQIATPPASALARCTRRVRLIDATRLRQVGGCGDDWRVHFAYHLTAGRMDDVIVTDRSGGERLAHFAIQPGDILVADNGYGYRTHLDEVRQQEADLVTRITVATFPLEAADAQPFDALAWIVQQHAAVADWQGWCRIRGRRHAVRLIISKLPPDKVAAARKRKRAKARKAKRTITAPTLILAGWLILITTLDASWTALDVLRLYRARWQIELVFKRMKQHLVVQAIRSRGRAPVEATVRALLLAWALQEGKTSDLRAQLPTGADDPARPLSSWVLAAMHVTALRTQVVGVITDARIAACLPQLMRYLADSPRRRQQQEADIRRWLQERLAAPQAHDQQPLMERAA